MRLVRRRVFLLCLIVSGCASLATLVTKRPELQENAPALRPLTSGLDAKLHHGHRRLHAGTSRSLLSGIGSWYGDLFDGQETASGEIFDQDALTACHPTLPFGTLVRVINLRNRRSVVVRINDRGVRPDRVIDLSSAAAEKIGMLDSGVAPVKLEILPRNRT